MYPIISARRGRRCRIEAFAPSAARDRKEQEMSFGGSDDSAFAAAMEDVLGARPASLRSLSGRRSPGGSSSHSMELHAEAR
jgi:hypothetical protein